MHTANFGLGVRLRRLDYVPWQRGVLCTYVQHDNGEALAWGRGGSSGRGWVVGLEGAQLESCGLKPDFCLGIDFAHKTQCGLTLKIININGVLVGQNNLNIIVEGGDLRGGDSNPIEVLMTVDDIMETQTKDLTVTSWTHHSAVFLIMATKPVFLVALFFCNSASQILFKGHRGQNEMIPNSLETTNLTDFHPRVI